MAQTSKSLNSKLYDRNQLRQAMMNLLARRDYSRFELQHKYAPKASSQTDLEQVLNEFAEQGWQSDERFCKAYLRSHAQRHGPLKLRQELKLKGVEASLIELGFEELDQDWAKLATDLLVRKFTPEELADLKQKAKAYRFLAQRGFTSEHINSALRHHQQQDQFMQ